MNASKCCGESPVPLSFPTPLPQATSRNPFVIAVAANENQRQRIVSDVAGVALEENRLVVPALGAVRVLAPG